VIKADQLQNELRRANLLPTRQRIALGYYSAAMTAT